MVLTPYKGRVKVLKKSTRRETFCPENGKTIQDIKRDVLTQQQKLAVALRERNITKANLQIRKMIRSKDCRILAVYNTISKKGYRSKGLKDFKPTTNKHYSTLVARLWFVIKNPKAYKATPLKRKMLPKPKGGLRPISVPTYFDRALQHLYKFVLDVVAEEIQSPYSFGFRPFRSPGWASRCLILSTNPRKTPPKFALELDIAKCYDTMDHEWMLNNICKISLGNVTEKLDVIPINILKEWLKCGFILIDDISLEVQPTTGIPQGGPISPTIANMVLNGVEDIILDLAKEANVNITPARFADDITLLFDNKELYQEILLRVDKFLEVRGMKLNRDKCFLRELDKEEPFFFVGFRHQVRYKRKHDELKKNNKLIKSKKFSLYSFPIPSKIVGIRNKITKTFNENSNKSPETLFKKLNPIIRGWLNFYCCSNTSSIFSSLSWWLWHKTFRFFWNKYRYMREFRNKSKIKKKLLGNFIIKKHTKQHGRSLVDNKTLRNNRWWVIPAMETTKGTDLFLVCPELTKVQYPPIIYFNKRTGGGLNAFHPEDRLELMIKATSWRFGTWAKALQKTKGSCGLCKCSLVSFTEQEIIELHHVNPIQYGGPRSIPNLLPLCKECHKDISIAVSTKNIDKILFYEEKKVLEGVSKALFPEIFLS